MHTTSTSPPSPLASAGKGPNFIKPPFCWPKMEYVRQAQAEMGASPRDPVFVSRAVGRAVRGPPKPYGWWLGGSPSWWGGVRPLAKPSRISGAGNFFRSKLFSVPLVPKKFSVRGCCGG